MSKHTMFWLEISERWILVETIYEFVSKFEYILNEKCNDLKN